MNSAPEKSLQEFLKLLFPDKWLPPAQTVFHREGARGTLHLPAAPVGSAPEAPFITVPLRAPPRPRGKGGRPDAALASAGRPGPGRFSTGHRTDEGAPRGLTKAQDSSEHI